MLRISKIYAAKCFDTSTPVRNSFVQEFVLLDIHALAI